MEHILQLVPGPEDSYWQQGGRSKQCFSRLCVRILEGVCCSWGHEQSALGKPQALLSEGWQTRLPPHIVQAFQALMQGTLPHGLQVHLGSDTHCALIVWATRYWGGPHTKHLSDAKFLAALPPTREWLQQVPCCGSPGWQQFRMWWGSTPAAFYMPRT